MKIMNTPSYRKLLAIFVIVLVAFILGLASPLKAARDLTIPTLINLNHSEPVNNNDSDSNVTEIALRKETDQKESQFQNFLNEIRAEAILNGIDDQIITDAFANLKYHPKFVKSDKSQPEQIDSSVQYISLRVTKARVNQGVKYWQEHRELLQEISEYYGIAPQYLLALWAVESDFGANRPKQPVIAALASLAFDLRRRDFFRRELIMALKIVQAQAINPNHLMGSWAGAMGQIQFMPSSYLKFAVHWDNYKRAISAQPIAYDAESLKKNLPINNKARPADIWYNNADVLASIANYLRQSGWNNGTESPQQSLNLNQEWGIRVTLPAGFDRTINTDPANLDSSPKHTWHEWKAMGVAQALPDRQPPADFRRGNLIRARKNEGNYYIVFDNFNVFLKWNRSILFGLVAGELADLIELSVKNAGAEKLKNTAPLTVVKSAS